MMRAVALAALLLGLCLLTLPPRPGFAQDAPPEPIPSPEEASPEEASAEQEPEVDPLVLEFDTLYAGLVETRAAFQDLNERLEVAEGEDRALIENRAIRRGLQMLSLLEDLVGNLERQEDAGLETAELRGRVAEPLTRFLTDLPEYVDEAESAVVELRRQRETATGEDLVLLETVIAKDTSWVDQLHEILLTHIGLVERAGLDARDARAFLVNTVAERAENSSARLELANKELADLSARSLENPDDAELQARVKAAALRKEGAATSLTDMVQIMKPLDLETAEYRRQLLRATGEITTDVFDSQVVFGLLGQWMVESREWLAENTPRLFLRLLVFLGILFAFRVFSRVVGRLTRQALAASRLKGSGLLQNVFAAAVSNTVMALGVLVALSQIGISLGPILAGLGVAGFIVGFALQDTLGNFAAGVMILAYRPYDEGDLVEVASDVYGRVNRMSLVSTTILTFDNQTLVVPNSKIWGNVIKNVTAQAIRRVDLSFRISYRDDLEKTEQVLYEILSQHPLTLADPAPMVRVHKLDESWVELVARPWVNTPDYWDVYWDITREVKLRFDREGITIPVPQQEVRFEPSAPERPEDAR